MPEFFLPLASPGSYSTRVIDEATGEVAWGAADSALYEEQWRATSNEVFEVVPQEGLIYVVRGTTVYTLDFDGVVQSEIGSVAASDIRTISVNPSNADIYLGDSNDVAYALNYDGTTKWTCPDHQDDTGKSHGIRDFAYRNAEGWVYSVGKNTLRQLWMSSGNTDWTYSGHGTNVYGVAASAGDSYYLYTVDIDGEFHKVDPVNPPFDFTTPVWSINPENGGGLWSVVYSALDDRLYTGSSLNSGGNGILYGVETDGTVTWSYQVADGGENIYDTAVGSNTGRLYAATSANSVVLEPDGTEVFHHDPGAWEESEWIDSHEAMDRFYYQWTRDTEMVAMEMNP